MTCARCDDGWVERLATPEEVDAGCELGIAYDPCPVCRPRMVKGEPWTWLPGWNAAYYVKRATYPYADRPGRIEWEGGLLHAHEDGREVVVSLGRKVIAEFADSMERHRAGWIID